MKKNNISVWSEDSDLSSAPFFQDESPDQRAAQLLDEIESVFSLVTEEAATYLRQESESFRPSFHSIVTTDEIPTLLAEEKEKKKKGTPGRKRRQPKPEEMADSFEMEADEFDSPNDFGGKGKIKRRRQIDPTTCERDYSLDEVEFMNALDEYKRKNGRMFPTCSEILEVIRSLGYVKMPRPEESLEKDSANNVAMTRLGARTLPFKEDAGQMEEIVTVFWNQETLKCQEELPNSEAITDSADYSDFDYYREPLLIF